MIKQSVLATDISTMKDSNKEREKRVDAERLSVENHLRIDERMAVWSPYGLNLTGQIHPPHQFIEICFSYHLSSQVPAEVRAMYERGKATMSYGIYHYPLITVACDYLYRMMEAALHHYLKLYHPKPMNKRCTFFKMLEICEEEMYIQSDMLLRWQATRQLRNMASHKMEETVSWSNQGLSSLQITKELLESLYVFGPPNLGNFYRRRQEHAVSLKNAFHNVE